ncbi:ligand-binding sensor domain-containing protein [Chitinophaga terrae (ex Kim and Jung 2007)]|uniref:ligand-binding sensor domain-containing protein n=1 Tax=Chitinophaga terrae (ex Kim and Jung 2007) TaxID=408074 RepID=UPI0027844864|nr:two-component regulator propeller domain-containing protein [Chitinophaga terrae (ex Kim and Jung 2007)]MDQ0109655.1 ligand-binding sensor domain-containing protein [Chitinophaga terrae (ex Kim and Jung 2007)]
MFRLPVLIVLMAVSQVLTAQSYPRQFETVDSKMGLSSNQINCITKDNAGFMWFGTMAGLNRFDGYSFRVFRHKPGDTTTLSDDYINQVVQGPHHLMWVQTPNGWNIYDPGTERFAVHLQNRLAAMELPNEEFTAIVPDSAGCYWFVVTGKGVYRYNPATRKSTHYSKNTGTLYSDNVTGMATDHQGNIWMVYAEGVLEQWDRNGRKTLRRNTGVATVTGESSVDYKIFVDPDNDVWLYRAGQVKGAFYYQPASGKMQLLQKNAGQLRLNNDIINGIAADNNKRIWIATDHGGINLVDKQNGEVSYVLHNEREEKSLGQNSINAIFKDDAGIIWLGTFKKGVNYFHESSPHFPLYQQICNW